MRLPLKTTRQHKGIAVEWARRKLSELVALHREADSNTKPLIRDEAIELALAHHQVSRFTSLVAVDQLTERAGGLLNTKLIPANSPKGFVNQSSSTINGIRLAQTATDLPFHLWLGTTLFSLSVLVWFIHSLVVRNTLIKNDHRALS